MRQQDRVEDLRAQKSKRKATGKSKRANRLSQLMSFGFGGVLIVAGVAFGGHYMGQKAAARGLPQGKWADIVSPSTTIMRKSSLLDNASLQQASLAEVSFLTEPKVQTVSAGKADYMVDHTLITGRKDRLARLQNLITSPPMWKLEQSWKLGQKKKRKIIAARRNRLAQSECLSRAIYFEARSESELGQLAVAKVILNRVKSANYPNNICGVVYQGSERPNSCQFSFACDGQADKPKYGEPWREAKRVAKRALSGSSQLKVISTATHYHADYVKPKWAGAMSRLIKIGSHIFYQGT